MRAVLEGNFAIHRARHLAASGPVLFTTYTRNLARAIENQQTLLAGPAVLGNVDVVYIDALARRVALAAD